MYFSYPLFGASEICDFVNVWLGEVYCSRKERPLVLLQTPADRRRRHSPLCRGFGIGERCLLNWASSSTFWARVKWKVERVESQKGLSRENGEAAFTVRKSFHAIVQPIVEPNNEKEMIVLPHSAQFPLRCSGLLQLRPICSHWRADLFSLNNSVSAIQTIHVS